MKAVIESIGRVGSRARIGEHELVFDQPRSVPGGEDRGPSPLDVMVVSVAACASSRSMRTRMAVVAAVSGQAGTPVAGERPVSGRARACEPQYGNTWGSMAAKADGCPSRMIQLRLSREGDRTGDRAPGTARPGAATKCMANPRVITNERLAPPAGVKANHHLLASRS